MELQTTNGHVGSVDARGGGLRDEDVDGRGSEHPVRPCGCFTNGGLCDCEVGDVGDSNDERRSHREVPQ